MKQVLFVALRDDDRIGRLHRTHRCTQVRITADGRLTRVARAPLGNTPMWIIAVPAESRSVGLRGRCVRDDQRVCCTGPPR